MKMQKRIARKGDTAAKAAQPKQRPGKTANGHSNNEALDEPAPVDTRLKTSPALIAELRRFLSRESAAKLDRIATDYGVSIEAQLAGTIGAWLCFVEYERQTRTDYQLREQIREYACVLTSDDYHRVVARLRGRFISDNAKDTYKKILRYIVSFPLPEAAQLCGGLAQMLCEHPGFVDEEKALQEVIEGFHGIGQSEALRATGEE